MTVCTAAKHYKDDGEVILTLYVKGHANYAESGKDIVCSAVSCLCISLANTLMSTGVSKKCFRMDDGSFYMSASVSDKKDYAEGAFDMAVVGLQSIADQYPDHVKIASGVSH